MRRSVLSLACVASAALLAGCQTAPTESILAGGSYSQPTYGAPTASQSALFSLPQPSRPIAVAVYSFTDQTGQFRQSETGQTLSRAVSQGGASILAKALQDTGRRSWFTVVEREQLAHLLNERQIIREMRERYLGETSINAEALPAMLFAGVLLEGGIIGYDSNTITGGSGAAFLGIGARSEYRQDTVTVYLRAVSVRTGEILTTVTASKTIASYSLGGGAFRYVGFKELLEAEAGMTTNEPDLLALQQAIEKAVYGLVMEGVELRLWNFKDEEAGWPLLWQFQQERDGNLSAAQVATLQERAAVAQQLSEASPAQVRSRLQPTSVGADRTGQAQVNALMPAANRSASAPEPTALTRDLNTRAGATQ